MADNKIVFGGAESSDYGIYISGEGVFNAPARAVEMVTIPGRNGTLAIDQGRYENIEVKYPAFNYEPTMAEFIASLDGFRNAICSQAGYKRLTDTIHADEYRLAIYRSGLEVNPIMYNTGAKFDITFDCKPQRYLTSGDEATVFTANGSIVNPTLYTSNPILIVSGNGTIEIGDYTVTVSGNTDDLWIDTEMYEYFIPGNVPEPLTDEFLDNITDELGFVIEVTNGTIYPRPSSATVTFSNHEYPKLIPGQNAVNIDGVTSLTIIPRWWQL